MIERGQLYRFDFGPRGNHLQGGIRPVVVLQSNALNRVEGYRNVLVAPLTTKQRKAPTYVPVSPNSANGLEAPSWVITNQIQTLDQGDLGEPLGRVTRAELFAIKEGLKTALGID